MSRNRQSGSPGKRLAFWTARKAGHLRSPGRFEPHNSDPTRTDENAGQSIYGPMYKL